jgi:hypothetical protein
MTYTFKLSRQLAVHRAWAPLALLVAAACNDNNSAALGPDAAAPTDAATLSDTAAPSVDTSPGLGAGDGRTTQSPGDVKVSPDTARAGLGQVVQFTGASVLGDSSTTPLAVTWTATGGTIDSTGQFTAGSSTGTYQVIGRTGSSADTSTVLISPTAQAAAGITGITPLASGVCSTAGARRVVSVSSASGLTSAINNAQPGDLIQLASGTYTGRWTVTRSGTSASPIRLCGPSTAVLNGGSYTAGTTIWLKSAKYWTISGVTVQNSLVAIAGTGASFNTIDGVTVTTTGQAGINLREFSKHNTIIHTRITDTGRSAHQYGEGVYIGTYSDMWCQRTGCQPDRSDSNMVYGNTIGPNVRADLVDIKDGTTGTIIRRNSFNGSGMVTDPSAPVWVVAAGNKMVVDSNTAVQALSHGMKLWRKLSTWGNNNVFRANTMDVRASGYALYFQVSANGSVVRCDNKATNAGRGLSNVACQ